MADNAASNAGMDEIRGHIEVLTARMKQLSQGGGTDGAKASDVLDDISDYYERAVQLRTYRYCFGLVSRRNAGLANLWWLPYRITSLEEALNEANTKTDMIKMSANRGWWTARICMFLVILVVIELFDPGFLKDTFANRSMLSHAGVALVSMAGVRFLSR